MIFYPSIEKFVSSAPACVLAAGVFDGVHLGHRKILEQAIQISRELSVKPGVLTLHPHPVTVLCGADCAPLRIVSREHKLDLLTQAGAEVIFEVPFDASLAATPWRAFLQKITAGGNLRGICAGQDWTFGAARQGTMQKLRSVAEEFQLTVAEVPTVLDAGTPISSTRIREAIRQNDFATADRLLGRPHTLRLPVQRGAQLGRQLGFPTANLSADGYALPPDGVYAVFAKPPGFPWLPAIANLGHRPTIAPAAKLRWLEVHLFDFSGDLYDSPLEIRFVQQLRPERKFGSLQELQSQIAVDCQQARGMLRGMPKPEEAYPSSLA